MKKLLLAVMTAGTLWPALASAEDAKAEAQPGIEAPKQTTGTTTTTAQTGDKKEEEKKDEKKPEATATTTQQPAQQQQAVNASLMTPEQLAAAGAWTFGINLDNSVGSGTFANAQYYSSVSSSLSGSFSKPFRMLNRSFMVNGGVGASWEYSTPDAVNARRLSWGDARVGLAMPGAFKEKFTGISFNPSVNVTLPITPESWYSGQISNLGLNLRLIRNIGAFSLRYGIGGGYTITTAAHIPQRPTTDPVLYGGPLCRVSDPAGMCGSGGLQNKAMFNTNMTVLWFASDAVIVYGQVGIASRWRTPMPRDEFTSQAVDHLGRPAVNTGLVPANVLSSAFGAAYNITDIFSVSATLSNDSPPYTNNGSQNAIRFPFFDFLGPELNRTAYTVSLSATL